MSRRKTQLEALTCGQLAQRWGVAVARVQALVGSGKLPGVFKIPSAGRYGETVKIPLASVMAVEKEWEVSPEAQQTNHRHRRGRQTSSPPTLDNFPELSASPPEHDDECHGGDQH